MTAVFVHNKGNIGFVPMHPLDAKGKTPRNLEHGILSAGASSDLSGRRVIAFSPGEKWGRLKSAPKEAFNNALTPTAPPVRVSRTVLESSGSARVVSTGKDSSIVYDPKEHRFVNSNNNSAAASSEKMARGESEKVPAAGRANRDGNATVAAAPFNRPLKSTQLSTAGLTGQIRSNSAVRTSGRPQ